MVLACETAVLNSCREVQIYTEQTNFKVRIASDVYTMPALPLLSAALSLSRGAGILTILPLIHEWVDQFFAAASGQIVETSEPTSLMSLFISLFVGNAHAAVLDLLIVIVALVVILVVCCILFDGVRFFQCLGMVFQKVTVWTATQLDELHKEMVEMKCHTFQSYREYIPEEYIPEEETGDTF
jgi:hypothetical protein